MKIKYALIIVCLMCTTIGYGQSHLFDKYADMDHVTSVYISKSMFRMMGSSVKTAGLQLINMADKIDGLQVLTTENKEQAERMRKDFSGIVSKDHEELMRVRHEKTRATFHIKKKGEMIQEMLMLADTNEGFTIIQLLGNFTLEDIQEITSEMEKF